MVTQAMHPARRRRLAARMPRGLPHDVVLRPLGGEDRGLVVTAEEQDFVAAVLADLKAPDWETLIARRRGQKRGEDGVAELSQPLNKRFHLVLLEAVCSVPGFPRVDPAKLAGMGLVLRREAGGGRQGWMRAGAARRGWLALADEDADPDPEAPAAAERAPSLRALDRLLARQRPTAGVAEQLFPLYPAPPDVCEARRRTILYGLVPVASAETTETTETLDFSSLDAADDALIQQHFTAYLKERPARPMPRAGRRLRADWRPLDLPVPPHERTGDDGTGDSENGRLYAFARFLQQLASELGAFEGTPAGDALVARLDAIRLPVARDADGGVTATTGAGGFARAAAPILLRGEENTGGLRMPLEWPAVDAAAAAELQRLARVCLSARFAEVAPRTPKFDRDSDRYTARAFVRVAGHADCPPRLVWSASSEPFRIRPWWDNDAPPTRVTLPDLGQLRRVRPGVSFAMPPAIANLLQGDMKELKDGKGSTGGVELGWICSFSIPAITICAFIVLSIFLQLFHLIFGWLFWIRICLPFPRPK